jgi:probable rRNA maturation factor
LQVEVSVQDCFFESSLSDSNLAVYQDERIAPETWENWFECWLEILSHTSADYELSLRLTNDAEIQALNAQYRKQNKPTDVLAFAALEVNCPQPIEMQSPQPVYLGDIVISVDTANRQAQQQGHHLQTELVWLATHGLLHLLGWDHPDEDSLIQMLDQQYILLQALGITVNTT